MATLEDLEKRYSNELEQLRADLKAQIENQGAEKNADELLSRTDLDDKLARFVVLNDGTPRALAEFEFATKAGLVELLLGDATLQKEILLADGARVLPRGPAQYGPAMQIFTNILSKSQHAQTGVLSRLALAIALEHAVPIPQDNPVQPTNKMDTHVDPCRRYLNYEKAYLEGELDPAFDVLTTWELRYVVDGTEPDETAAWGRAMLRNYRPDHILSNQQSYTRMVNSNIRYGGQHVKYDKPELQKYQNILMNGGVCGRRAFFGRFLCRAFGIPTTARPSRGHGALVHWTRNAGWVVQLGGNWGCGWTNTQYRKDLDFLATTQARTNQDDYWKVKRAQWIGDVMCERRFYGEHDNGIDQHLGFWYSLSLKTQRNILDAMPDKNTIDRDQGNKGHRQSTILEQVLVTPTPPDAKKIIYHNDSSSITIPAAAYENPRQTRDVQVMTCFCGGLQIYLPAFPAQGLTIMRGGTWKNDANGCCSGARIMSGGYGQYEDWGFRLAISVSDNNSCPVETLTIDLDGHNGVTKMELVYIKPGTFVMGGESTIENRFQCVEVPKHTVRITKGFYLGKYPVTQAQYQAVIGSNPSKSTKAPDCPVDNIGVDDALHFCDKLVETIGMEFRLPTEAEWEYACRAGQGDKKWFFGDDSSHLGEYSWFGGNSGGKSHPVGQKKPNPFGLYDMYGNVYERVSDKYSKDYYAKSPSVDPTGPIQGTKSTFEFKVLITRGGVYTVAAEVVTANDNQRLNISVNGDESSEKVMTLPFTNGRWQNGPSVELFLEEGENTIRFWRDKPPQYGIAIRTFTIEPSV